MKLHWVIVRDNAWQVNVDDHVNPEHGDLCAPKWVWDLWDRVNAWWWERWVGR